jgi:hypothetical protein
MSFNCKTDNTVTQSENIYFDTRNNLMFISREIDDQGNHFLLERRFEFSTKSLSKVLKVLIFTKQQIRNQYLTSLCKYSLRQD